MASCVRTILLQPIHLITIWIEQINVLPDRGIELVPRIGEKDIHMQVMVEDSGIGLEKAIQSHTEVMEMVLP